MLLYRTQKEHWLACLSIGLVATIIACISPRLAYGQEPPNDQLGLLWSPNEKYNVVLPVLPELQKLREKLNEPEDAIREAESALHTLQTQLRSATLSGDQQKIRSKIRDVEERKKNSGVAATELRGEILVLYKRTAEEANAAAANLPSKRHKVDAQHVERWSMLATNLGKAGLVTALPMKRKAFVDEYNGTWKLESRIMKGQETDTTAMMYFDLDTRTGKGQTLILEGGTVDAFAAATTDLEFGADVSNPPFSIGGLFDTSVRSVDSGLQGIEALGHGGSLVVVSGGEIVGSYNQAFRSGVQANVESGYQGFGGGSTMVGGAFSPAGSPRDEWARIEVIGDKLVMVSSNQDLVDTYTKVSDRPVGTGVRIEGIWPLKQYWELLRHPIAQGEKARDAAAKLEKAGAKEVQPHHFLLPPDRK